MSASTDAAHSHQVTLRTPATTANLGPGFDSFGMALKLYNHFSFQVADADRITVSDRSTVPVDGLSRNPEDNLVFKALTGFYQASGQPRPPMHVEIEAHIPLARGLGSSSTAIAAGLFAGNVLNQTPLTLYDLVTLGEALEGHPDNVAPALLGGTLLCDGSDTYPLPWPTDWQIVLAVPHYPLLTEKSRGVMPENYSLEDAIYNLRKASLLTYAILKRDPQAFCAALEDRLHQPYRGPLIQEFVPLRDVAQEAGAMGTVISGAGSTMAIFYERTTEHDLVQALQQFRIERAPQLGLMSLSVDHEGTCAI